MSGKLDQSLEEITSAQRRAGATGRRRNPARRVTRPAAPAPAGGIQKNTKGRGTAAKSGPAKPSAGPRESKIIVSNMVSSLHLTELKGPR